MSRLFADRRALRLALKFNTQLFANLRRYTTAT